MTVTAVFFTVIFADSAHADPPWVTRRLTLLEGETGVNLGVGLADDLRDHVTGSGVLAEVHYGITDRVEVAVRDGIDFNIFGRWSHASQYGRLYTTDAQTVPANHPVGNPDVTLISRVIDRKYIEVGLELGWTIPINSGDYAEATFGTAIVFHYSNWLRLDTGGYVTGSFRTFHRSYVAPVELWFQPAKPPFWFGPIAAVRSLQGQGYSTVPVGMGVGYGLTRDIDLRGEVLVSAINRSPGAHDFGGGVGGQWRF